MNTWKSIQYNLSCATPVMSDYSSWKTVFIGTDCFLLMFVRPVMRDHLFWETTFAGQKWRSQDLLTPATRNTQHYNLPYASTEVYKSSFFPSTIKLWNKLQPAVINSTTIPQLKPASHYKLIRRFRRSRRCCGSCRDFRLTTGTLRLADARAQTDNWIGDPSAKTKPATPFPDHCMTKKCPACDNILNFRPIM